MRRATVSLEFFLTTFIVILFYSLFISLSYFLFSKLWEKEVSLSVDYSLLSFSNTIDLSSKFVQGVLNLELPPYLKGSEVDVIPLYNKIHYLVGNDKGKSLNSNFLVITLRPDLSKRITGKDLPYRRYVILINRVNLIKDLKRKKTKYIISPNYEVFP